LESDVPQQDLMQTYRETLGDVYSSDQRVFLSVHSAHKDTSEDVQGETPPQKKAEKDRVLVKKHSKVRVGM
jgi:hypothetical protein